MRSRRRDRSRTARSLCGWRYTRDGGAERWCVRDPLRSERTSRKFAANETISSEDNPWCHTARRDGEVSPAMQAGKRRTCGPSYGVRSRWGGRRSFSTELYQEVGSLQPKKARNPVIVDACRNREDHEVDWYLSWHPSEPPKTRGLLSTGANCLRQGKAPLYRATERGLLPPAMIKVEWAPCFH